MSSRLLISLFLPFVLLANTYNSSISISKGAFYYTDQPSVIFEGWSYFNLSGFRQYNIRFDHEFSRLPVTIGLEYIYAQTQAREDTEDKPMIYPGMRSISPDVGLLYRLGYAIVKAGIGVAYTKSTFDFGTNSYSGTIKKIENMPFVYGSLSTPITERIRILITTGYYINKDFHEGGLAGEHPFQFSRRGDIKRVTAGLSYSF